MKKLSKLFLIALSFSLVSISTNVKAQAVEQGTVIIDGYWGFPNLWTSVLQAAYAGDNIPGVKVGTFGPIGGRLEYLLSDKVGLGIDVHSATSSVEWTDLTGTVTNTYKVSANRLRVTPRINIHWSDSDKLDFYGTFGIGYKNTNMKFESTDPTFGEASGSISLTPVTWRAGIGIRYFFIDNVGMNLEMGLGGVLMTGGLSFKF